jgi:hypothetical protein
MSVLLRSNFNPAMHCWPAWSTFSSARFIQSCRTFEMVFKKSQQDSQYTCMYVSKYVCMCVYNWYICTEVGKYQKMLEMNWWIVLSCLILFKRPMTLFLIKNMYKQCTLSIFNKASLCLPYTPACSVGAKFLPSPLLLLLLWTPSPLLKNCPLTPRRASN